MSSDKMKKVVPIRLKEFNKKQESEQDDYKKDIHTELQILRM